MASKQKSKSKKFGSTKSKAANSLSYSTTSSSKQYLDTSIDGQSSPASSSVRSKPHFYSQTLPLGAERSKENVTVTVRFRPLSPREIRQGEEIAWYADGETIVRNEHNPSIAYAYDRVFGPTTTTRNVYDVAAQHVVSGAMEGISGTIFAYGVTSSGKTHTMHGDQRSPGIIPLAVKDAFSIIQETPNREFLLRVSYLEIYNEVMNDLLNPAGQNLRIREDSQGIFVEGIKEEVVLSPAHALSLIAAGEEHRHVGSTNFNLLSSRSHTIFTLTIESSPCGENSQGEAVSLSQLNLIDLAGSESSKAETTGVRRKEGSYINKSLLTLGTVISKLTDGRAAHIPYRDSKLTRLLQSSLSGHGRVSLICTVTPSSSSSEETHNTLKFAHRAKHIEIQAAQNKIIDEKSLIKKYQNEIRSLKEELEQLRRGIVRVPQLKATAEEDLVLLKQKLEDGQVKLQSRLEQEEEAKAALLARIQRLTKLILVSSKASQSSRVLPHRPGHRRRYSFGEEELACLPHKRQDLILDNGNIELHEGNAETTNATLKEKKTRKHGLLNWLMPRKRESGLGTLTSTSDKSSEIKSMSTPSTPQGESSNLHTEARLSHSLLTESSPSAELLSEAREDREVHGDNFRGHETPLVEMKNLKDEIMGKNEQIALLEKQITDSIVVASHKKIDNFELSHSVSELMAQLNEKSFELEVKAADNRVIQEQLNQKISECGGLQDTIASLKQQLSDALESSNLNTAITYSQRFTETESSHGEDGSGKGLLLGAQATAIEELKQKVGELTESKEQLELRNQKLAEESSYAKGLASAAAVELKALSEEVAKLMNHNERLAAELAASKNSPSQRRTSPAVRNGRRDSHVKRNDQGGPVSDIKRELAASRERELSYEAALLEKDQREAQLQRTVEESKQREAYLENELANMWVLVAKLKNSHGAETEASESTRQTPRVEGFGI
ncbi:kinesin-like protein KIN-7K, chloroplastic isoform X2 [Juglans microcarpa x Juglans regia]|uniref:kinesin-like protein KIN-7K, chloroplastic isoform X2 n=1 Tax=Juglans microcarpa x Juglans regia TaxID=2249226 RepID=UPI001B7E4C0C|nr:kinesin-like protein KIN-7K, chloroplastic isoform X2 [Juglans microcarpa x Juglans regia]